MRYSEFISTLRKNPDLELSFEFDHGLIRGNYHITEVLNVQVEAIDCGGAVETWSERVLQLLEPGRDDGLSFMTARKAIGILERSAEKIDLSRDGIVIVEYRPRDSAAAQRFKVSYVKLLGDRLMVHTNAASTQCKAAARTSEPAARGAAGCCG